MPKWPRVCGVSLQRFYAAEFLHGGKQAAAPKTTFATTKPLLGGGGGGAVGKLSVGQHHLRKTSWSQAEKWVGEPANLSITRRRLKNLPQAQHAAPAGTSRQPSDLVKPVQSAHNLCHRSIVRKTSKKKSNRLQACFFVRDCRTQPLRVCVCVCVYACAKRL